MLSAPALRPRPAVDKRLVLAGALLALVAVAFWTGSRYPALDEKAMMGGDADIEGLAFDRVVAVEADAPVALRVGANAINWAYTNKQGMTFGVLFAAVVLTVLPLVTRRSFSGRMSNTLLGVAMGAPLGVCVNCAVPVAEGLHAGGARGETTVAALLSSPTLNVVVLGMTFALFPLWLASLKLALTLAFIVLAVPVIVHALWGRGAVEADALAPAGATLGPALPAAPAYAEAVGPDAPPPTWAAAAAWTARALGRNLWYIAKTTVPLMLLAGVLGAVAVTVLPWERLVDLLPAVDVTRATGRSLVVLGGLAVLGTFLPVPIAFDVVICAILSAAGVPLPYVAVLFVTLGLFSAYPLLQIWRTMSRGAAVGLFVGVAALGLGAGWTAAVVQPKLEARAEAAVVAALAEGPRTPPERPAYAAPALPADSVAALLAPTATAPEVWRTAGTVTVLREPLAAPTGRGGLAFDRIRGRRVGMDEPSNATANRYLIGVGPNRGAATGDVHGDGWADVVLTSEAGVGLYANVGGRRFVRQEVAVPALDTAYVTSAALVDLDGDGALDLVVATWGGNHVVYNDGGAFTAATHHRIPNLDGAVKSTSLAFGDIDRDGDLDLVAGNVAGLNTNRPRRPSRSSLPWARNALVLNDGGRGRFRATPLPGVPGETLSALLSDLDGDGDLDLIAANDFSAPDVFYDGDGAGGFTVVPFSAGRIPFGGLTSMSATSADLDNDLSPEIYIAQISRAPEAIRAANAADVCRERPRDERAECRRVLAVTAATAAARGQNEPWPCLALTGDDRRGCLAAHLVTAERRGQAGACAPLHATDRWPRFRDRCGLFAVEPAPVTDAEAAEFIPNKTNDRNALLRRAPGDGPARFVDVGEALGLEKTGWTWDARFADFDLDGFVDLFVTNGTPLSPRRDQTLVFRNVGGERFENVSEASGAGSWQDAYAHTVADLDRDGDLDVVVPSTYGPVDVLQNRATGRAVQIALRDGTGANRFGIGAVVTITLADGSRQMREVQASGGYLSFDEPVLTFGLGDADAATAVEVRWPTGGRTTIAGPFPSSARYTIAR